MRSPTVHRIGTVPLLGTPHTQSVPALSGSPTALLTGPARSVDYVQWLIDGSYRLTTSTFLTGPAYSQQLDTTTCFNGFHVVQPVSHYSTWRSYNIHTATAGLVLDLDFSNTATLWQDSGKTVPIADGAAIAVAQDSVGVFADFLASVGPVWKANQYNGLGCACFTGVANQLLLSNGLASLFSACNSGEIFIVASVGGKSENLLVAGTTANNTDQLACQIQNNSGSQVRTNVVYATNTRTIYGSALPGDNTQWSASNPSGVFIANFRNTWNGSSGSYPSYLNGISNAGTGTNNDGLYWFQNIRGTFGSTLNVAVGGYKLGTGASIGVSTLNICEILIYNLPLSSNTRNSIETALAAKWLPSFPSTTAGTISGVPTQISAGAVSNPYATAISYTATLEAPYAIHVNNTNGLNPAPIKNHYTHIKTMLLKYPSNLIGNSLSTQDQALCANSLDAILASIPAAATNIKSVAPNTKVIGYDCIAFNEYYNQLDWLNYADANNYSRELMYWHVSANTSYSSASWGTAFPVSWFWDCQKVTSNGAPVKQYTGTMGTASANLQNGTGGSWANGDGGNKVTLGPASGDYVMLGYHEKFDEINFVFNTTGAGGYAYTVEYPTSVNADNTPKTWAAFTTISDGTTNATASGRIHFDPHPTTPWVKSVAVAGGSGLFIFPSGGSAAQGQILGYYVRVKTTAAGTRTPICTTILACDYMNQGNNWSGTIPQWNGGHLPGQGNDLDGDGYLNDTEYSAAGSPTNGSNRVRWYYQTRLWAYPGTNVPWLNFNDTRVQTWVANGVIAYLALYPQYDGLFLDNSSQTGFNNVMESSASLTYADDYGACVNKIWSGAPQGTLGQSIYIPNLGADGVTNLLGHCPGSWHEGQITEADGYTAYNTHLNCIAATAAKFSPPPVQVIDSYVTYANTTTAPTDATKLLFLAGYYCASTPQTYFGIMTNNSYLNGWNVDDNFYPNRWIPAITTDIGQPTQPVQKSAVTVQGSYNYQIFSRDFDHALVIYRPLNDNGVAAPSNVTNTDTSSATNVTVTLPAGNFKPLNADGTLGGVVSGSVTITANTGLILMKQ